MPTLSASAIAGYAKNAGVTGQNIVIATAVALAESSGNTDATNSNGDGSTDFGLWQINSVHSTLLNGKDWRDPAQNAAMMFSISNGGTNWRPWVAYTSGRYLAKMSVAQAATPDTSVGAAQTVQNTGDDPFTAVQKFAHLISDPRTWARLGMVIGGSVLLLVAIHKAIPVPVPGIAKIASKVVL